VVVVVVGKAELLVQAGLAVVEQEQTAEQLAQQER
jgi:hypothetical protein